MIHNWAQLIITGSLGLKHMKSRTLMSVAHWIFVWEVFWMISTRPTQTVDYRTDYDINRYHVKYHHQATWVLIQPGLRKKCYAKEITKKEQGT